ncbi:hypothetical protein D3C71_1843280 [compost metagenome]
MRSQYSELLTWTSAFRSARSLASAALQAMKPTRKAAENDLEKLPMYIVRSSWSSADRRTADVGLKSASGSFSTTIRL